MEQRICFTIVLITLLQRFYLSDGSSKKNSAEEYFTQREVVLPRVYNKQGKQIFSTLTENGHVEDITVLVPLSDKEILLDLHLNKHLFPGTYIEKSFTSEGVKIKSHHSNKTTLHCYYHGNARDLKESVAAVSTCDGIRATIYLSSDTLHLEPKSSVIQGEHVLFRDSNHIPTNHTCGVNSFHHHEKPEYPAPHQRLKREIRWPAKANKDTKIVELYVVNDYRQYVAYDQDTAKVVKRTKEVINAASALYKPINIHIAMVGIEIWTDRNEITITEDAEQTMKNFLEYRKTDISPRHKNDNAQLLTDHTFGEGVIGKAPINTMCSWQYSGGVNMDHHALVGPVATTVAHEMGHNFGLAHDGADCSCPESRCIMNRNSGGNQPKHWSSCSKEYFEDAFHQGMDYCLHDLPGELYQGPVCGNGFMEDGEECDCGTPDSCDSKCCDAATCTLFNNATCATGACCDLDTCQIKKKSTPCREEADVCDLGEYCHGNSEFCPSDAYKRDGTECEVSGQKSYCYKGRCRNRESQCQLLWGSTGHDAADICYTTYNKLGIPNGHCGFHWIDKTFDACAESDVRCGMLHCRHRSEKLMFWQEPLSYTMPESHLPDAQGNIQTCSGAILDVGLDYQDPGMVPEGAKCAYNKICIDAKCTSLHDVERKECPDCHGKGTCNHLGQCHCDVGYAPPTCERPGHGGSQHSGPIKLLKSNRGLVIGMIVLFVVILPILAAFIYIGYRHREEIKKFWEARTREDKYRYSEDAEQQNRQEEPRPQPTRPAPAPPAVSPNVGAHGGFNTQPKSKGHKPERPPQPRFGAGYRGNESVATVTSNVPNVRPSAPVSPEIDGASYYQNVPNSDQKYVNVSASNAPVASDPPPSYNSAVANMINKFEQPSSVHNSNESTFEHTPNISDTSQNKRPVPRPRSMAQTGLHASDTKKPDLPRKPPLPAPLSRNPTHNTGAKPTVTPKPFVRVGENRNGDSIC